MLKNLVLNNADDKLSYARALSTGICVASRLEAPQYTRQKDLSADAQYRHDSHVQMIKKPPPHGVQALLERGEKLYSNLVAALLVRVADTLDSDHLTSLDMFDLPDSVAAWKTEADVRRLGAKGR